MKKISYLLFLITYLLYATPSYAHGFGQRIDVPVPLWLIILSGGITVLVSFLFLIFFGSKIAKTEKDFPHKNAIPTDMIPTITHLVRYASVVLFALIIVASFFGTGLAPYNFASVFIWVIFGVGLAYIAFLVADVWPVVNPWQNIMKLWSEKQKHHEWPKKLNHWLAVFLLFAFLWFENIYPFPSQPKILGIAIIIFSFITFMGMSKYGVRSWTTYADPFAHIYRFLGKFAPITTAQKEIIARPYAVGLIDKSELTISETVFILLMLAGISFDGLKGTSLYLIITTQLTQLALPLLISETVLFLCVYAIFITAYFLICRLVDNKAWSYFILSLIPIAAGYELAHFATLLLLDGQRIIYLISDPLGLGWNLFGTAGYTITSSFLNLKYLWYFQIVVILIGHIIAVWIADRIALLLYKPSEVTKTQIPLIALMIIYTMSSLWIISQPVVGK